MECYKSGGCGVYEMYACNECPASKPDYVKKQATDKESLLKSLLAKRDNPLMDNIVLKKEDLAILIPALDKSVPKEVKFDLADEMFPDNLVCPACGTVVGNAGWGHLNGDFCSCCGQALFISKENLSS